MKKRSLCLCMAAGLMASLAFATPSQAGPTLVTTDITFTISGPNNPTITDLTIQYTPAPMPFLTAPVLTPGKDGGIGAFVSSYSPTLGQVTIDFTASASTTKDIQFTFLTSAPVDTVGGSFLNMSGTANPPVTHQTFNVNVTPSAVPEPASLALLGIGMTGFLAFRRFLKRSKVA
jgi:hypothetical protein